MTRLGIGLGLFLGSCVALFAFGKHQYNAGVRATTATFVAADKKGAETVHETATKTLAGIGSDADPDSLLEATEGFRD